MDRETYIADYIAQHFSSESHARQLEIMHGLWVFFDALSIVQKPSTRFDSEPQEMVESESPIPAQSHSNS
jgi:hypothetical protein